MSKIQLIKLIPLILFAFWGTSCVEVDTDSNTELNPERREFRELRKRVMRFDCDGLVTSDEVERLHELVQGVVIPAKETNNLWRFRAWGSDGDYQGTLWRNYGDFKMEYGFSYFNLGVREGLNEIQYQFGYCNDIRFKPLSNEKYCAGEVVFTPEESYWVEVTHTVENLTGLKEIHPSKESCES